jgi:GTP-binding protein
MRFVDEAIITVESGKGGKGLVHFRREKFIPLGGPDGGDGGRGGHVILMAGKSATLLDYHHQKKYIAASGQAGGTNQKTGAAGADLWLDVPLGTSVYEWDPETRQKRRLLADLTLPGQQVLLAKGGRGGRGNTFFKSSVRQAPQMAQLGEEGTRLMVFLELKLFADVGLVGFPNAGKSSFLRLVSQARPKVADYPFTTLHPHLGVVRVFDTDLVISDLPGLIEGAAEGVGLGHRFLKHIERTRCLLIMLNGDPHFEKTPHEQYLALKQELLKYNPGILAKPTLVGLNKIDLIPVDQRLLFLKPFENMGMDRGSLKLISTVSREGIDALLQSLREKVGRLS